MKNRLRRTIAAFMCAVLLFTLFPAYATMAAYPELVLDEVATVQLDGGVNDEMVLTFTPTESGFYSFTSEAIEGGTENPDTVGALYDSEHNLLGENDDYLTSHFCVTYALTAGETYYVVTWFYNRANAGSYGVVVKKAAEAEYIEIDVNSSVDVGNPTHANVRFYPAGCLTESVVFSCDDAGLYVAENIIMALRPGRYTLRAESESGLVATATVTAAAATALELDVPVSAYDDGDYDQYVFTAPADGDYIIYQASDVLNSVRFYASYVDGTGDICTTWPATDAIGRQYLHVTMKEGEEIFLRFFYEYTGAPSVPYTVCVKNKEASTGISFPYDTYYVQVGHRFDISALSSPEYTLSEGVGYSSTDYGILDVNHVGIATAIAEGSVTVTATSAEGYSDACTVYVTNPTELTFGNGNTAQTSPGEYDRTDSAYSFTYTPANDGYFKLSVGIDYVDLVYVRNSLGGLVHSDYPGSGDGSTFFHLSAGDTYTVTIETLPVFFRESYKVDFRECDEYGNVIHKLQSYTFDEQYHYGLCDRCGETVTERHTLDENGYCQCGYLHVHTFRYLTITPDSHEYECTACLVSDMEPHSFDSDGFCACGYVQHEHVVDFVPNSTYDTEHSGICRVCLLHISESHVFGEDGTCACGYVEHVHEFDEYTLIDYYGHTYVCSVCGFEMQEEHSLDEDGQCACGYAECAHVMDVIYCYEEYHVGRCSLCDEYIYENHTFDGDGLCSCGAKNHEHDMSRFEYADLIDHAVCCTDCSVQFGMEGHSFDADGLCVCGYSVPEGVVVGGTLLQDGQYIDRDGAVTSTDPSDYAAFYKDGILTLSDTVVTYGEEGVPAIYSYYDLTVLVKGSVYVCSEMADGISTIDGNLTITGADSDSFLIVRAIDNYDGIDAVNNGDVVIQNIELFVYAGDNGIEAEETLTVNSGTVAIYADDYGLDAEDLQISGGNITVYSEDDGIDVSDYANIDGGTVNIYSEYENGISADNGVYIDGGAVFIDSDNYGILSCYGDVRITAGTVSVNAEAAVMAGYDIIIDPSYGYDHFTVYDENEEGSVLYSGMHGDVARVLLLDDGTIPELADLTPVRRYSISTEVALDELKIEVLGDDTGEPLTLDDMDVRCIEFEDGYFALITAKGGYIGSHVLYCEKPLPEAIVCGITLEDGDYLAVGASQVTDSAPEGVGYAHLKDGVLTLYAFSYEGEGFENRHGYNSAIVVSNVRIKLVADNHIACTRTGSDDCISADGDVSFEGDGLLSITGAYGIYSYSGSVSFTEGNYFLDCAQVGIQTTDGSIEVDGGTILSTGTGTHISSGLDLIINGGLVQFSDGNVRSRGNESFSAERLVVNGGRFICDSDSFTAVDHIEIDGGVADIRSGYILGVESITITSGFLISDGLGISVTELLYCENGCLISTADAAALSYRADEIMAFVLSENMKVSTPAEGYSKELYGDYYIFGPDDLSATAVVISSGLYGDVNADSKVNLSDASALLQSLVGWDVTVNPYLADTNGDGTTNLTDVARIMQYVAKWDVTLG